jgi:hypothetical protein
MQHNLDLEEPSDVLRPPSRRLNIDRSTHLHHDSLLGLPAIRNWRLVWIQFTMHGEALKQREGLDKRRPVQVLYMKNAIHDTSTTLEDRLTSQATIRLDENNNQVINHLDDKRKSDRVLHTTRDWPSSPYPAASK